MQTQASGRLVLDRDVCLRRWTSRNAHVWVASTKEDGGAPLVEGSNGLSAGTCLNTELTRREVPVTVRTGGFRLDNLRSDDAKQVEVHHVRVGITCDFQGFSSMLNKGTLAHSGPWCLCWWSRRRRQQAVDDVTYLSPQGRQMHGADAATAGADISQGSCAVGT